MTDDDYIDITREFAWDLLKEMRDVLSPEDLKATLDWMWSEIERKHETEGERP